MILVKINNLKNNNLLYILMLMWVEESNLIYFIANNFRTGRIGLHENDNPYEVAKNFAMAF